MIRFTTATDTADLMALAEAIGLFEPKELAELKTMLLAYLSDEANSGEFWLTNEGDDGPVGVAYCAPERMTEGTWNLLFIAIHPDHQGQGRGGQLIRHIEQLLKERGAHLLIAETLAEFEQTRAFYRQCGYREEAHIHDFYAPGADKIVYCKALTATAP
ncbi:MAG: GNAT family N-acetyltransferase [Cyanobacteria bacterium P01_A01_bin.135]